MKWFSSVIEKATSWVGGSAKAREMYATAVDAADPVMLSAALALGAKFRWADDGLCPLGKMLDQLPNANKKGPDKRGERANECARLLVKAFPREFGDGEALGVALKRGLGGWAAEIFERCKVKRKKRAEKAPWLDRLVELSGSVVKAQEEGAIDQAFVDKFVDKVVACGPDWVSFMLGKEDPGAKLFRLAWLSAKSKSKLKLTSSQVDFILERASSEIGCGKIRDFESELWAEMVEAATPEGRWTAHALVGPSKSWEQGLGELPVRAHKGADRSRAICSHALACYWRMQLDALAPSPGKEPVPQMWRLMLIDATSDEAEMAADILASRMKTLLGIKPANGPIISSECPVILDAILAAVEPRRALALATKHGVALSVLPILRTRLELSELEREIGFEKDKPAKPKRAKARL